ncbi:M42 family metallopeptidase [Chloroflexota bacterium]
MSEILDHLKEMISISGLSGFEKPIRDLIQKTWEPLADEISVSKLGSLHALRRGRGPQPRSSIMVATHMDAIGLIVTKINGEFLHITELGGIDPRVLPGQQVTVHGAQDLPGVVVQPSAHTLPDEFQSSPVPLKHLLIDVGFTANQVSKQIKIGDLVSFATEPIELKGDLLAGHSLDNRASVAALTKTLKLLQTRHHDWDVWAVATAQEEETLGGALTSGFDLQPSLGVVIDVTFAKGPGASDYRTSDMDKGPTLAWGPNTHPKLYDRFEKLAKKLEIPVQREVYHRHSGTDAITLQIAGRGIPTMVVCIPLRYMHTPVEMVHLKDVARTGRLLAEFITALDEDTMEQLKWDKEES